MNKQNLKSLFGKYKYILLLAAAGVLLLLIPFGSSDKAKSEPVAESAAACAFELDEYEQRLAETLAKVRGVGKTRVMLYLAAGGETVYARNTTVSTSSSQSSIALQNGAAIEECSRAPVFGGAVVVCEGADNASVKLAVTQAVMALTGLGADKVSVLPME